MFSVKMRQIYFVCDKIIVRGLRNESRARAVRGNPGLDKRIQAFKKDGINIQDDDAEEFIEQSESSFYEVGETYNEHLNETLIGKHELRHHIVKEKYFKENMPNLLTWSEKEQIRHLANLHPNDWTPQRLAESFPVTEQVVKKILKYPWKPASELRIARHDASAMRNWRELKEGTLDIPEHVRQHFMKFSDRNIPPLDKKSIKIDIVQEEKIGEFEKIIKKCSEMENTKTFEQEDFDDNIKAAEIVNKSQKRDFKKVTTLGELATKIKDRIDKGKNIDMSDKIIVASITSDNSNITPKLHNDIDLPLNPIQEKRLSDFKDNEKKIVSGMNYPERIRIPKKAYKRGATYKVNDCFYDHDGRFLYRVTGMSQT